MKSAAAFLALTTIIPAEIRFVDRAAEAGLKAITWCGSNDKKRYIIETLGTGVAFIDYDRDGLLDIFLVTASTLEGFPDSEEPVNRLYRNRGQGKFEDATLSSGLARSGWGQGVCAGDVDGDGYEDLLVSYYGHDVLYRNSGNGSFEDVTARAGLKSSEVRWGTGCAFLDYDRDGKLDLFISNYVQFDKEKTPTPDRPNACQWKGQPVMCGPRGLKGGINRLWKNVSAEGKLRFEDVSAAAGITAPGERYSLSATVFDYNRDSWPDIYVAVDSQASILYRNNRDGTFTDTGVETGVAYSEDGREQAGMGTAAGDYDGDGLLDLIKTNFIDDTPNLYRNNGDGSFTEKTFGAGLGVHTQYLGWGAAFVDIDNDTWLDVLTVNGHVYPEARDAKYRQPRLLFRNLGNGKLKELPGTAGENSSRGLAVGDVDNDGDIDFLIMNMNEPPSLLINESVHSNKSMNLSLAGTKSNRSAIGARVMVTSGGRTQIQEVRSGSTFLSQSDLRLHFGLGASDAADKVEIEWPSGGKQSFTNVQAGRFYAVTEGRGISIVK